jgi:penicillin amidase
MVTSDYHAAGVVPIRKSGDGSVPYDGSTDAGEWISYIPIAKLPQLYDPPSESSSRPTSASSALTTLLPDALVGAAVSRAAHLRSAERKTETQCDDFRRIQGDVYSIAGRVVAQEAVKTLRPKLTRSTRNCARRSTRSKSGTGRVNAESTVRRSSRRCESRFAQRSRGGAWSGSREELPVEQLRHRLDRIIKEQPPSGCRKSFRATPTCCVPATTRPLRR